MRTAKEMYAYCKANNFGRGFNEHNSLKHFEIIANNLQADESVELVFIGLHNYQSATKHDNNYAYAITNKRIMMAQKKVIGSNFQTVSLDNINDITFTTGMVFGIITVDTMKERFNVAVDKATGESINTAIHETLDRIKSGGRQKQDRTTPYDTDIASHLEYYQQLVKDGLITEKDYETKKRQLLGL